MTIEPALIASAEEVAVEATARRGIDHATIAAAVLRILEALGEDPQRPGLVDTPRRVAEAFSELLAGSAVDPLSIPSPLPDERSEGLIMVRDIPLVGVCEHHLLPFIGRAAVAYLPGAHGRITGLSKLPRLIDVLARRLTVQERLVREAADALEHSLDPKGVFVLVEAEHLCVRARGARSPGATTVTTEVRGLFAADPAARAELVALTRPV